MKRQIFAVIVGLIPGLAFGQAKSDKIDLYPRVVERGPDHRVWQTYQTETNSRNQTIIHTNSYTELQMGLHFKGDNGEWEESQEAFDIQPGKAVAKRGRHAVCIRNNIHTAGAVEITMSDGKVLRTHPLGLGYYDGTNSVLIAEVKDCEGVVVGANQVVFEDAFTGIKADLRYTYTKSGFEQDVILREQPPKPGRWNLPETANLEMLTEFLDDPKPMIAKVKRARTEVAQGFDGEDEDLDFGSMRMRHGKAFVLGDKDGGMDGVPVSKQFLKMDGRDILVEGVSWKQIVDEVKKLPEAQVSIQRKETKGRQVASVNRVLPQRPLAGASDKRMEVAAMTSTQKGYVLDYVLLNSSTLTNYTFRGDSTYYISGTVQLSGTNNTLEGGAVIKYARGAGSIQIHETSAKLNCKTLPYRPVVCTAIDDNSVGETISGSTGVPTGYYSGGVGFNNNGAEANFRNIRISYLSGGIYFQGNQGNPRGQGNPLGPGTNSFLSNAQIVNCGVAVYSANCTCMLRNVLIAGGNSFYFISATNCCENVTFSGLTSLMITPYADLYLTNCLVVAVSNTNGILGGASNQFVSSAAGVFQTAANGYYYLATNSPYRNAGTMNINPDLVAELRKKTTYPPLVYSNFVFTGDTMLGQQAQRDTDAPDLGYHYDPLDYALVNCTADNARLTITNGTAIAICGGWNGLSLQNNSSLFCVGTPPSPNWFVGCSSVQEQPQPFSSVYGVGVCTVDGTTSEQYRFTKFACLASRAGGWNHVAGNHYSQFVIQDCEFWNGMVRAYSWGPSAIKNNLFVRTLVSAGPYDSTLLRIENNTFWNSDFYPYGYTLSSSNNVFDSCYAGGPVSASDYNAYLNCTPGSHVVKAHDIEGSSLAYQSGALGDFYQPIDSPLINQGSTNADLIGLYHYTTQTSQEKEMISTVDMGYHYVAVDSGGKPADTDADGNADYADDADGDGLPDAWELHWFGNLNHTGSERDTSGKTLADDYQNQNGTNPNIIQFTIGVTNSRVSTMTTSLGLNITAGDPSLYAVEVDNTNFLTTTHWSARTQTNLTVNLGTQEGWHDVWVGLRGPADTTNAVWCYKRLKLDLTPPTLILTSPVGSTICLPVIQLKGYSPEPLSSIQFDLHNSLTNLLNQEGLVCEQDFDEALFEFGTNRFQCYDVPMAPGINTIVLGLRIWPAI